MRRVLVLLLTAVSWVITIVPSVGADVRLRVGVYQNAPKIFHDESGRVQGFWPDLIEAIAAKEEWAIEYVTCEWEKCLELLEKGDLDAMPDVAHSATRAVRFTFGKEVVFHSWSQLFHKPDKSIFSILDLSGLRVAALSGSIQEEHLAQRFRELGISSHFVHVSSLKTALSAVKDGTADLGVVNRFFGARLAADYGLVPSGIIVAPSAVLFAFAPGTSSRIIDGFDEAIARLKLDGGSVLSKGLAQLTNPKASTFIPQPVYWATGVGLLFLSLSFGSTLILRRVVARRTQELRDEIREHTAAEKALRDSEERYRLLLDSSGEAIYGVDLYGNCTFANPASLRMLGYHNKQELLGRNMHELIHHTRPDGSPYPEQECRIYQAYRENKGTHVVDEVLWRADGSSFPAEYRSHPLYKEGQVIGSVVAFVDISERQQAEEVLRRTQKMDAIGQLSGGIAHDFNNQLGVVIGYLDYLNRYFPEDEKPHRWVETATKATLRCMSLTRQLLAFSSRQSEKKVVVDLNKELKEMENMITRSVTPEIDVHYALVADLDSVSIDPGEFQDAILNLVINARSAMQGSGKLLIETSNKYLDADYATLNPGVEPGDYLQLILSDTGVGMDKETMAQIFEPFFTTKTTGTGLGLTMVYGFVKRYGGNIEVSSEPGMGSAFRINLPCSTVSKSTPLVEDSGTDVLPIGCETILIVDDEEDLLRLADLYLSGQGYHTLLAKDAAQALEMLATEEKIDLLFSDVVMPGGMNGYELVQHATEQNPGLKVLLTSGFTDKTAVNSSLTRFAAHLLKKPYRKDDLALRIRLVLDEA